VGVFASLINPVLKVPYINPEINGGRLVPSFSCFFCGRVNFFALAVDFHRLSILRLK